MKLDWSEIAKSAIDFVCLWFLTLIILVVVLACGKGLFLLVQEVF